MDILRRLLGLPTNHPVPTSTDTPKPVTKLPTDNVVSNTASAATVAPIPASDPTQPAKPPQPTAPMPEIDAVVIDPTPMIMPPGSTRQLPPLETYVSKPGKHLLVGVNSDVGMVRNNNQDSVYTMFSANLSADEIPDFGLFVVADGMGGHQEGEKASAITTRTIAQYIADKFYMRLLNPKDDTEKPVISEILAEAVQKANDSVAEKIPQGGTTVTAAVVLGDLSYIAHVGDSRAYLITGDSIDQITRDHSLVQRLIELDQLTPDEAASHPQRNVLYRALGQGDHLEVDAVTRRLPPGARLMLCSDGLWNQVPEATLRNIVTSTRTPQEACDKLIAAANEHGGLDNISVVIVQVPG